MWTKVRVNLEKAVHPYLGLYASLIDNMPLFHYLFKQ